ncbi:SDR family oxidoreductase [Rhizobium leguminosarum]|uniref:SDR family oxidoreductase n=1 Tax=Rhizobium leguminosarum TaxID=384 RepID=UPI001441C72D|nr:SDR family oxidoreductase [Rhizobium leguminosarum]NKK68663.1 NAD(P)H-binding protein [Rhizobium leguminosarum bv. viciae]NKL10290.1 NAD(P)H-binding protein [Rhizobium leguminosarum bv. viciae]NKL88055.1 NAD(P)H-binding protein [Rhizobium leguminosarum bv. viciae]NKL95375.1 NAD(P)H-binding protein [Rhizobium leguminosarum bv. viciae]NKM96416.1 NAD(P)H-binding protein [Rhizobium leguminosarum bv. viciae]
MQIGVSGAGGKLGSVVVSELLARGGGHGIVGISRSPEKLEGGFDKREGDYDRPEGLVQAYQGLDRLLIIPSADLRPGIRGVQMKAAIDAALKAGVGQIFLVSAAGTREAAVPELGESYWTAEQALIRSASRWTILRMNYYAEAMQEEIIMSRDRGVLVGLGDERVAYASRDDMAAALAGALVSDGHSGAIYNLTGPDTVTGQQRAAIASAALRSPFSFAAIEEDQLRAAMSLAGLPDLVVAAIVEIKKTFIAGYFDVVTGDIERLSGRKPRSFRDVLAATPA